MAPSEQDGAVIVKWGDLWHNIRVTFYEEEGDMVGRQRGPRIRIDIVPWLAVTMVLVGIAFVMVVGKPTNCPRDVSSLATSLPSCRGMNWTQED